MNTQDIYDEIGGGGAKKKSPSVQRNSQLTEHMD